VDLDLITALRPNAAQGIRIALLAQNLLDDVALVYERLHGLFAWSDHLASLIVFCLVAGAAALICLVGLPILVIAAALFALRPPRYRDPLPTPPEAFFARLPCATVHKKRVVADGRVEVVDGKEVVVLSNTMG
jgi:hypothetical protein